MVLDAPEWVMSDTFADWLARAKERRGVSGNQLAKMAGVSQSTVSKLETGARDPSREMAIALADGLAIDGESAEDAEARRNSSLLAAGYAPDYSPTPEMERIPEGDQPPDADALAARGAVGAAQGDVGLHDAPPVSTGAGSQFLPGSFAASSSERP
jgi:transcriptional regulator with XRE-family HTH domain